MLSPRVLLVLACAVLALAGTCTAFINTADMTHSLPYDHANVSRGRFMHVFRGSTTKPTDNAFVFVNDADSLTFDVATNAPASIFSTYQARFNASFFFIPLRFHQASTGVPPFEHRDTVHMEHMVNDLHVLLTEHDILKKIPKIVLVGTGRGGAVAAHYRALYATLNRRVLGAFVDTPHMRKLTYSRIFSPPSGVSADCTGAIASAIKVCLSSRISQSLESYNNCHAHNAVTRSSNCYLSCITAPFLVIQRLHVYLCIYLCRTSTTPCARTRHPSPAPSSSRSSTCAPPPPSA